MSDALDYLVKTRPDAMTSYFKFLKETGKSLDPKTRMLITVITKIATQTEKGLRQYLPRALDAGATPNEILDAILHAFPALGLAKIVWAIDILIDMDIPEFRAENLGVENAGMKSGRQIRSLTARSPTATAMGAAYSCTAPMASFRFMTAAARIRSPTSRILHWKVFV